MKRYILNILGSFGSGKSSLARALMPTSPQVCWTFRDCYTDTIGIEIPATVRPNKVLATWFENENVVFIGPYRSACGGCDALIKDEIFAALNYVYHQTSANIIFEGVAVSGVRTYLNYMQLLAAKELPDNSFIQPLVIALHASVETHTARVMQRNGGKPINPHHIKAKHRAVESRILELVGLGMPFTVIDENSIDAVAAKAKAFIQRETA